MFFGESPLITLVAAARRLKVPKQWLAAEAAAGRVPCVNADGVYLFDRQALDDALVSRIRSQLSAGNPADTTEPGSGAGGAE